MSKLSKESFSVPFMFMLLRMTGNTKLCPTVYAIPLFKQHSRLSEPFVSVGEFVSQLTTSVIVSDLEQVVMTQGSSWHVLFLCDEAKLSFFLLYGKSDCNGGCS